MFLGIELPRVLPKNLQLPHPVGIIVHEEATIGKNCTLYQNVTIGTDLRIGVPKIGENVTVYAGAVLLGPIEIGSNSIVGPNSVVTKNFSDGSIIAGIPAKLLRIRTDLN